MIAIRPSNVQSFATLLSIDHMSEAANDPWHQHHCSQMSLPINQYSQWSQEQAMGGMHDRDLRMFHDSSGHYEHSLHATDGGSMMTQPMSYMPDASWSSDMDIGTPSTTGFPTDTIDGYHSMRHTSNPNPHLNLPFRHERIPSSAHSPQSSYDGLSPHLSNIKPPSSSAVKDERPNLTRSITAPAAPDQLLRQSHVIASNTPSIKRSGSEDEDDDYVPGDEPIKPRGRKRQRIPHTAVERRYRENLNMHLDRLRQTVPSLAARRPAGNVKSSGDAVGEGAKPSKCEILNGAIEHIGALGKENSALKTEVEALRSRLEDVERWCSGGFGK